MILEVAREEWSSANTFAGRAVLLTESLRNGNLLSLTVVRYSYFCLVAGAVSSLHGVYTWTSVDITFIFSLTAFNRKYWCRLRRQRRRTCQEEVWWPRYGDRKKFSLLLQCSCEWWVKQYIRKISLQRSQSSIKAGKMHSYVYREN